MTMNTGSPDFLSIEDTSEEAKIAKSLNLELHLEIHQSRPRSTADNFFSSPYESSLPTLDAGHASNDDFTSRWFNFITNRFPILLRATALFCNYRIRWRIICISVQSGSMKTSFSPWRGFFPRAHRRQLHLLNDFSRFELRCVVKCQDLASRILKIDWPPVRQDPVYVIFVDRGRIPESHYFLFSLDLFEVKRDIFFSNFTRAT